jgi:hypothetical protein
MKIKMIETCIDVPALTGRQFIARGWAERDDGFVGFDPVEETCVYEERETKLSIEERIKLDNTRHTQMKLEKQLRSIERAEKQSKANQDNKK